MIQLSDEEWMSMIDLNRDGLPACCGVVSEMRDLIIMIARQGGDVLSVGYVQEQLRLFRGYHEPEEISPVFVKFAKQIEALVDPHAALREAKP